MERGGCVLTGKSQTCGLKKQNYDANADYFKICNWFPGQSLGFHTTLCELASLIRTRDDKFI